MVEGKAEPLAIVRRDGPVAWLTLNRPERLNSFTAALHADLAAALDDVERDPPRVLILTGAGRGFCAGQDITERLPALRAGEAVDLGTSLDQRYNPMARRLSALPMPVIAAVNGVAAGAGVSMILTADIVVAAESARFILAFANIGLGPDAGLSWTLPRLIGKSRALALILTGGSLTAQQAQEQGIVWQVVADDALTETVTALAAQLVAGSAEAQALSKLLVSNPSPTLNAQLERERDAQFQLGHTPFYREAMLRFGDRSKT